MKGVEPIRHAHEPVSPGSPWQLKRHIGMGSFGEVWLAENPDFPVPRAYKFFTRDGSGEWLRREQKSLVAILTHLGELDQIVDFEDVDTHCEYPFLAFEYMAGGSLEDWILEKPDQRPALQPAEIVRQVAVGLAAAHREKIQHRDIKPANILLTGGTDPQIKIGDFGLAKVAAVAPRAEATALASLVGTVGTPLYLPPESQQRSYRRRADAGRRFRAGGRLVINSSSGRSSAHPYDFAERLQSHGSTVTRSGSSKGAWPTRTGDMRMVACS